MGLPVKSTESFEREREREREREKREVINCFTSLSFFDEGFSKYLLLPNC